MSRRIVIVVGCVLLLIPLVAHAYAGTASRFVGDDYCGGYIFHDEGFWGGQRWFYLHWGAVPSTVFLIGLTNDWGVAITSAFTAMGLAVWVAALAWTIGRLLKAAGHDASRLVPWFAAELVVFATLYDAPNVIQSAYLRVPMFEYVIPLVLLTIGVGAIAGGEAGAVVALVLAFVAGNFGPTYAAMQTAACGLALGVRWLFFDRSRRLDRSLVAAALGSIAALACIALAPGNAARQTYFPPPPGVVGITKWTVLSTLFMFARPALPLMRGTIAAIVPHVVGSAPAWLGIALAMTASPLTIVLLVGIPFWIALDAKAPAPPRTRHALVWLPLVAIVLVMACMAPSAYGTSSPPPPRTLVIPQFAIASLLAAWSYALGRWLRDRVTERQTAVRAALLLVAIVAIVAPLRGATQTIRVAREMHAWASRWDEADRELRRAASERAAVATVTPVGAIGGVGSISADPNDWVNACAAKYYHVQRIAGRSGL